LSYGNFYTHFVENTHFLEGKVMKKTVEACESESFCKALVGALYCATIAQSSAEACDLISAATALTNKFGGSEMAQELIVAVSTAAALKFNGNLR
jgi:hypothetical protein